MGTNYYGTVIPTAQEKDVILEKVLKGSWVEAKSLMPPTIHIGKSAIGWRFCFNHNDWDYFGRKDIEQMKSFLRRLLIADEYGREISFNDFWELVESKQAAKAGYEYHEEHMGYIFSTSSEFS